MSSAKYIWIRTRDNSSTLWSNELGESFRSVKGAFTESWVAFVGPALAEAAVMSPRPAPTLASRSSTASEADGRPSVVGEFGLGAGTNWMLWTLASRLAGIESHYFVIERDRAAFDLGRARWLSESASIADFLARQGLVHASPEFVHNTLSNVHDPIVFPSIETALVAQPALRSDIWFHDPFGYDVNPDGYSAGLLAACHALWAPQMWGASYACNRKFRESLATLGDVEVAVLETGAENGLKRERLEFRRHAV